VACNDQAPGTATLIVTGDIPEGTIGGPVAPASIVCAADGSGLTVIGLTSAGSTPVLLFIGVAADHFTVSVTPKGGGGHFYLNDASATMSLLAGGAHVSGEGTETSGGANALKIHLDGDLTCG
jgi:hypothetical protein